MEEHSEDDADTSASEDAAAADEEALLTDEELDNIRQALGVPDDADVEYTLSDPWYWEAAECGMAGLLYISPDTYSLDTYNVSEYSRPERFPTGCSSIEKPGFESAGFF